MTISKDHAGRYSMEIYIGENDRPSIGGTTLDQVKSRLGGSSRLLPLDF